MNRLAGIWGLTLLTACGSTAGVTDADVAAVLDIGVPRDDVAPDGGPVPDATAAPDVTPPADATTSPWRTEPPLPAVRQEIAVALLDDRIYVIGGFESGVAVGSVRIFDPATRTWSVGPSLPDARHHVAVAVVGRDLYALGGYVGDGFTPNASCFVLSPGATTWRTIAALPTPRAAAIAGVIDGEVLVAGGLGAGGALLLPVARYRPAEDTWRAGANITTPREHLAGFVYAQRLWAVGGRRITLTTNMGTVETYDPARDEWTPGPALAVPRGGLGTAVLNDVAYAIGGEQPDRALVDVETLDLTAPTAWRTGAPTPTPHHGHGVIAAGGRIYVLGGGDRPIFAPTAVVESLAPMP